MSQISLYKLGSHLGRYIVLWGVNQGHASSASQQVHVEETPLQNFEVFSAAIIFVHTAFASITTVICDAMLGCCLGDGEDVCNAILVEPDSTIPRQFSL